MPTRKGRNDAVILSPEEMAEVRRIADEIMAYAVRIGFIKGESVQASMRSHIELVLIRNIAAAGKAHEAALAAEEIHTWEFGQHHISECQIDWCGRSRGQRRDSELRPAHVFGQDCPNYPYGCVICLPGRTVAKPGKPRSEPPAMPGPTSYCRACARSGVGACDDFPYCPGGGKSRESQ